MPNITLDIYARLHQATLRREELEAQRRFEKMGQQAGQDLTKGIEKAAPNIRRAMNSAADAVTNYTGKVEAANKTQQERNALLERAARLEQAHADSYSLTGHLAGEAAKQEAEVTEARTALVPVTNAVETRENKLREIRQAHSKTLKEVRGLELDIKEARLDGETAKKIQLERELLEVQRKSAEETATIRNKTAELNAIRKEESARADEVSAKERILSNLRKAHADAIKELDDIEKQRARTLDDVSKKESEATRQHDEITSSIRKRDDALRRLAESEVKHERSSSSGGGRRGGSGGASTIGSILTDIPFVPGGRAGAAIGTGVVTIMASAAEAAVTASQAIALLPAVAAAAGAGIATLAIGLNGFGDAITNLGDPKKFAEALEGMAPAAQQAALEIQYLVQGPLGALKDATQESLFSGVAEQLHTLTDTLLPGVQQLTTGIGTSFNQMFMNATNQLMTPESLASLNTIINNIVKSFQNLEPAVAPFVSAMTKITETGSSFLPGLADSITNAANSFNKFITQAQQDGSLKDWIQKGIDACATIIDVIGDVGKRIYDTFGNKSPDEFKQTLDSTIDAAFAVADAIVGISHVVNDLLKVIQPVADALGGWSPLIQGAGALFIGWKAGGVFKALAEATGLIGGDAGMAGALRGLPALAGAAASGIAGAFATIAIPMAFITAMNEFAKANPGVLENSAEGQKGRGQQAIADRLAQQFNPSPGAGGLPGAQSDRRGGARGNIVNGQNVPSWSAPPAPGTPGATAGSPFGKAGLPAYSPFGVPAVPAEGSQSKQVEDLMSGMDMSQFMPSGPIGATPGMPSGGGGGGGFSPFGGAGGAPPLEMGTGGKPYTQPSLGYYDVNDSSVVSAKNRMDREAYDVGQARMKLEALKKLDATVQDIRDAEQNVKEQEASYNESYLSFVEAQQGKWKKVKEGSLELGFELDKDFGISKGLAGIADNLTRFLGNLATAGFRGQLKAIEAADPEWQARLAAKNGTGGSSSFLGDALSGGAPVGSAGTPGSSSGAYPGDAALLAGIRPGKYVSEPGVGDLAQGIGDCTSTIEDLVNIMDGQSTAGRSLATGNADTWLPEHGFVRGMGGAGDFRVGYNGGHMQATLPGGTPWNWGGAESAGRAGVGGTGADDPAFTDHWYRPAGGSSAPGANMPGGVPGGMPGVSSGGVTPVFVVNMPGSGVGFPAGSAASGQGSGPPPGPGGGNNWDALMQKEAGGSGGWSANTGNGYYGGLQFDDSTWKQYGGDAVAPRADLASKEDQIAIAEKALAARGDGGASLWPVNYGQLSSPLPDPATQFSGGGGQGPIFKLPQSGAIGSGAGGGVPGPSPFGPGGALSFLPGAAPGGPMAGLDPNNPAGTTGGNPGGVGPFATPPGVNAGGVGSSARLGAGPGPFAPSATSKPPTPVGGAPQGGWQPAQTSSQGLGSMAGAAAAMAFPGAGEAAAKAGQLIDRSIKYGGQLAGIGISGLMETFGLSDPDGGGNLQQSWLGRVAGGLAQASPSMPSTAGTDKGAAPDPKQEQQGQPGADGKDGKGGGVHIGTFVQAENRNSQQVMNDMAFTSASKGGR